MGALLVSCAGDDKTMDEIQAAFERRDYRETVALCRHAVRNGVDHERLGLYHGYALVGMNRDYEGYQELDKVVADRPEFVPEVSRMLYSMALPAFKDGQRKKAARRMQKAAEVDPAFSLGAYQYLIADEYFELNNYEQAAVSYQTALRERPDTSAAEPALINLAECYRSLGEASLAAETLNRYLEAYPRGEHATATKWALVNLAFERGEKAFVMGNYEHAVDVLNDVLRKTSNRGLRQKTRFLLGESYEALGSFDQAYVEYKKIIDDDRGASGRIVERAREKIRAFREAGLN